MTCAPRVHEVIGTYEQLSARLAVLVRAEGGPRRFAVSGQLRHELGRAGSLYGVSVERMLQTLLQIKAERAAGVEDDDMWQGFEASPEALARATAQLLEIEAGGSGVGSPSVH